MKGGDNMITFFSVILAFVSGLYIGGAIEDQGFMMLAAWCVFSIISKVILKFINWIRYNKEQDKKIVTIKVDFNLMVDRFNREYEERKAAESGVYYMQVKTARALSFEERLAMRRRKTSIA
jgi:hypothetical protein